MFFSLESLVTILHKKSASQFLGDEGEFRIAINLSSRQLLADNFIDVLDATLADTDPDWIELEVTESLVMHDIKTATERLRQIQERGIHMAGRFWRRLFVFIVFKNTAHPNP